MALGAIECTKADGIVVKGNNGTEYCVSKQGMNQWTALEWYQSIGRTMIQYPEDCWCGGEGCPENSASCPNLNGANNYWIQTGIPYGDTFAYRALTSMGQIDVTNNDYRGSTLGNSRAFCK